MQLQQFFSFILAAKMAAAVNMVDYDPQPNVPAKFREFLEAYVSWPTFRLSSCLKLTDLLGSWDRLTMPLPPTHSRTTSHRLAGRRR